MPSRKPKAAAAAVPNTSCSLQTPTDISKLWIKKEFIPRRFYIGQNKLFVSNTRYSPERLTNGRAGHMAFLYNGLIYMVSGTVGSSKSTNITTYNPVTGECIVKTAMSAARTSCGYAFYNGLLYVVAGYTGTSATLATSTDIYDPETQTWTTGTGITTTRRDVCYGLIDGVIYVVGGYAAAQKNQNEAYDIATNIWSSKAVVTTARYLTASAVVGGLLYCIGGQISTSVQTVVECYDPETNLWSTKASLDAPITEGAAIGDDTTGKIYLFGGKIDSMQSSASCNNIRVYDVVTNEWTVLSATLRSPVYAAPCVMVAGHIWLTGGNRYGFSANDHVDRYVPAGKGSVLQENDVFIDCSVSNREIAMPLLDITYLDSYVRQVAVADTNGILNHVDAAIYANSEWTNI